MNYDLQSVCILYGICMDKIGLRKRNGTGHIVLYKLQFIDEIHLLKIIQ